MQEVELYLKLTGYAITNEELSAWLIYDITNDISLDGTTLEEAQELEESEEDNYTAVRLVKGIKLEDNKYFYQL